MRNKIANRLVMGCLATSLMLNPLAAYAEAKIAVMPVPQGNINGDLSKAKIPLDQAISKVKEILAIPNDYDRFESGFNSDDGGTEWNLHWSSTKDSNMDISVRFNATTGEILSMDRWEDVPGRRYSGLPKYSYDEGAKLAKEWGKKLAPSYFAQTKLETQGDENQHWFGERDSVEYYYQFPRVVNGVTFRDNNISVRINGDTGQIHSFYIDWDGKVSFPSTAGKISTEQAEKVLQEQVELAYFRPHVNGGKEAPVKLVYRVKKGSGLYIDALSGKVIEQAADPYYDREMDKASGAEFNEKKEDLTPLEQAEVDKYKNLISAEKALEKAQKVVKIPTGLKQNESRLSKNYEYQEQTLWNFSWQGEKHYFNIGVDASNGEVVSFDNWDHFEYDTKGEPKVSLEEAKRIAVDYLKKQQSQRFSEVRLEEYPTDGRSLPRSYYISFTRMVNGIPFPDNGFKLGVNPYTGDVTHYQMSWWNVKFPAARNLVGTDKATGIFMKDGGLTLDYLSLPQGDKKQVYLAYHLKDRPSYMLDASTGNYLNWQGEPIAPKQNKEFTDIAGHPAENDIKQLAKANVVNGIDGKFYPDRNITKIEALEMLVASRGWYMETPYLSMKEGKEKEERVKKITNAAMNLGIIEQGEIEGLDKELTRLEMVRLMINTLDYDGAAKLAGIYVLKSKDNSQIPASMKGYAALGLGLGLQTENKGMYLPNEKVPRGYAATAIVRMLKVQK